MTAYYNEIDPFAAAWLRNLIAEGHIAPGDVDERSIEDVLPTELAGYTQCHFFAGIGVWSYALRQAGWPDDRPIWTGSCPCQPFSAAGKGGGFDDERHLWPAFFHLIQQCVPAIVIGEQVASKDGLAWLDLVRADVEGTGRAFAAADLCAAGVGSPHIRQRSWWLAYADQGKRGRRSNSELLANGATTGRIESDGIDQPNSQTGGMANTLDAGRQLQPGRGPTSLCFASSGPSGGQQQSGAVGAGFDGPREASPTNGFWRDADWLYCRDGKWRPVEPGTFPLAHGATNRVGRLRGYGNAIVAPVAQAFIESVMEIIIPAA